MSAIDVIVPCYRYAHFLRECVQSVLTQSFKAVRVLILDDASPDNTPEVAAELCREDGRVTFIRHQVNQGHIETYNEGIRWVSSDYMLLLSADDYLAPGALDRAVQFLDAHPEAGFVFGRAVELRPDGSQTRTESFIGDARTRESRLLSGEEFIDLSGARCIVTCPTAIVRTALQKKVGGYRAELPHAGDMEMWLRLAAHAPVGFLDATQALYRIHQANMSHSYYRDRKLPDFRQRIDVVNTFLASYGHLLRDRDRVERQMKRLLSQDAVSYASASFNEGDRKHLELYIAMALELDPKVRSSMAWLKLGAKRRVGLRSWQLLKSLFRPAVGFDRRSD